MTQVVYTGENASHDWLCHLAKQPGQSWVENRDGELVIVHEFEDLKEGRDVQSEFDDCSGVADALQEDCNWSDPAVDRECDEEDALRDS